MSAFLTPRASIDSVQVGSTNQHLLMQTLKVIE